MTSHAMSNYDVSGMNNNDGLTQGQEGHFSTSNNNGNNVVLSSDEAQQQDIGSSAGTTAPFPVTAVELGILSDEQNRTTLADLLAKGIQRLTTSNNNSNNKKGGQDGGGGRGGGDVEAPESTTFKMTSNCAAAGTGGAAAILALLRSSPEKGIDAEEVEHRRQVFGSNALTEKKLDFFRNRVGMPYKILSSSC